MTEQPAPRGDRLTMPQISGAVTGLGWRYLLGMLRTAIPVRSLAEAAGVAAQVVAAAGAGGDRHLWLDLRPDQVIVTLQTHAAATVTARDVAIAGQLTAALGARGLPTDPDPPGARRSVQSLEVAIDALDTPSTTRRASPPGRAAGDV